MREKDEGEKTQARQPRMNETLRNSSVSDPLMRKSADSHGLFLKKNPHFPRKIEGLQGSDFRKKPQSQSPSQLTGRLGLSSRLTGAGLVSTNASDVGPHACRLR